MSLDWNPLFDPEAIPKRDATKEVPFRVRTGDVGTQNNTFSGPSILVKVKDGKGSLTQCRPFAENQDNCA